MLNTSQLNNLHAAAIEALKCEQATGIPCELILSQWAEESGWGAHSPGNNCFGIKQYPGCFGTQLLPSMEWLTDRELASWLNHIPGRTAEKSNGMVGGRQQYKVHDVFATFQDLSSCFIKRASLFNIGHYAPMSAQFKVDGNLVGLVQGISKLYATDPNYSAEILKIASMPEVVSTIKQVRG